MSNTFYQKSRILQSDAAAAAAIYPNGTNTALANSTYFINGSQLLEMVQDVYQKIYLTVLFWIVNSLLILYPLMNYFQNPYEDLRIVC